MVTHRSRRPRFALRLTAVALTLLVGCSSTTPTPSAGPPDQSASPRQTASVPSSQGQTAEPTGATAGPSETIGPSETVGPSETPTAAATPEQSLPPLPSSAELDPLPTPVPLPSGEPQQQAESLKASLRLATTPRERLPVVMTILLAAGIPIVAEDGEPVAFDPPPQGPAMRAWEVHALAATDAARHAQLGYGDLADLIAGMGPELDAAAVAAALSTDILTAAFSPDLAGRRWAFLLTELDRRGAIQALAATGTGDLVLDAVQIQLVLRRLAVELWSASGAEVSARVAASALSGGSHVRSSGAAASLPCSYTPVEDTIVTVAEETGSRAMGKVIELLSGRHVPGLSYLAKAGFVADIAEFIAPYLLLTIKFELSSPPLVRTKSTREAGDRRQIAATLWFDTGNVQLINCFRLVFASLGFTFRVPADGPLGNGSVSWEPRHGFERVQFYGDPVHVKTDDRGISIIGIEGRRQPREIPPTANRFLTDASVFLVYRIKELSLGGDLFDAVSILEPASGGDPVSAILKLALETISRAKWSSASFGFPVADWGEHWGIEIVMEQKDRFGTTYFSWTAEFGVGVDGEISGSGTGTIALHSTLCVDRSPDGHDVPIEYRLDANFPFKIGGQRVGDALNLLLPADYVIFREAGSPGPCGISAALARAVATLFVTTLMGSSPVPIQARPGTQTIPYAGDATLTIHLESIEE